MGSTGWGLQWGTTGGEDGLSPARPGEGWGEDKGMDISSLEFLLYTVLLVIKACCIKTIENKSLKPDNNQNQP